MVLSPVTHYSLSWDEDNNRGTFSLFNGPAIVANVIPDSPVEFQIIIDLLRNERPIRFDTDTRQFRVGAVLEDREPVGEEEA